MKQERLVTVRSGSEELLLALFKILVIHFTSEIVSWQKFISRFTHTVIDSFVLGGSHSGLPKSENSFRDQFQASDTELTVFRGRLECLLHTIYEFIPKRMKSGHCIPKQWKSIRSRVLSATTVPLGPMAHYNILFFAEKLESAAQEQSKCSGTKQKVIHYLRCWRA